MSEQDEAYRAEEKKDDVEAHGAHPDLTTEPASEDDSSDDVEAHGAHPE